VQGRLQKVAGTEELRADPLFHAHAPHQHAVEDEEAETIAGKVGVGCGVPGSRRVPEHDRGAELLGAGATRTGERPGELGIGMQYRDTGRPARTQEVDLHHANPAPTILAGFPRACRTRGTASHDAPRPPTYTARPRADRPARTLP
jgi:hypothetical protein